MQPRALSDQPRRATLEPIPSQPTPSATPLVTQGIGAREQDSAREETSMNALEERRQRQDERGPEDIARRQHESTYGATELQASNKEHDAAVLERAQRQRPEVPAGDGAADAGGGGAEKWGSRKSGLEAVGGSRRTASDAGPDGLQESLAEHYYRCQLYLLYLPYQYKSTNTDR